MMAVLLFLLQSEDPLAGYGLSWTAGIRWAKTATITAFPGGDDDERLERAQDALPDGGVLYFPPGTYRFSRDIRIRTGVVLRGADSPEKDARNAAYDPPSKLEFPKYEPRFEGEGTPIGAAFKGIRLADPGGASNCGVLNLAIHRGHVHFEEGADRKAGRNRFVVGCLLRNAAQAARDVPDAKMGQHAWQRWTDRFGAAVAVKSGENLLIANNRVPESGEDNFVQKGYVLQKKKEPFAPPDGVVFDYDNRPGIAANDYGIGGGGAEDPNGTPETHPWGFRKGIVIRNNFLFMSGRCAITFTGDGVLCKDNVIRFKKDVPRWTTTGKVVVGGAGTNDNRAVQMRGWRWRVEGNDYEVHRNRAVDSNYLINDGEGLMHEDHVNSTILDSALIGNKGNTYLSLYKCAGIQGLEIRGNEIRTPGGIEAIYVVADRNRSRHPCNGVRIEDNRTAGSGIRIAGEPGEGNVVRNNRHEGPGGKLVNEARAVCEGNTGYGP